MLPQSIVNQGSEGLGTPSLMTALLGHMRNGRIQGQSLPLGKVKKKANGEAVSTGSTGDTNSKYTASGHKSTERTSKPSPSLPSTPSGSAAPLGRTPAFSMKAAFEAAKKQTQITTTSRAAAAGASPKSSTPSKAIAGPAKPGLAQGGID